MVLRAQSTTTDYIRAKTNFNLSPICCAHKSSNHKFSKKKKKRKRKKKKKKKKISPDTNLHKTKHQTQHFRRISPFGTAPIKKAHKARTRSYRGPFRRFINTRFKKKKVLKKKRNGQKQYKIYLKKYI